MSFANQVTAAYRRYLNTRQRKKLPPVFDLKTHLKRWLAKEAQRELFELDARLPHEVAEAIEQTVAGILADRQKNAAKTRRITKKNKKHAADKAKQLTLPL